jgi:hypothetical protein
MGLKQLLIRLSEPQGTIDSGVEAQDLLISTSAGPLVLGQVGTG